MKHKKLAAALVCLTFLAGCAEPVPFVTEPIHASTAAMESVPASSTFPKIEKPITEPAPTEEQREEKPTAAEEPTYPDEKSPMEKLTVVIPVTEPESKSEETAVIPTEPHTEPIITVESSETPLAPTEQTTEPPTVPTVQIPEPTELSTLPTDPIPIPTEPTPEPTEPTTEPVDPEPEPLTAQMLRELEQAGLQYAVSRYGYEVDYSLGFGAVCGYYPGMSGYFNADGYDSLLSLVKTNVDVTTDYLMGQSGPIWGYREDNGAVWRTLINIAIVDDSGGSYTVWVFYG